MEFMRLEPEIHHRDNRHYLARMCCYLRALCGDSTTPASNLLKLEWEMPHSKKSEEEILQQRAEWANASRSYWFGLLGVKDPLNGSGT